MAKRQTTDKSASGTGTSGTSRSATSAGSGALKKARLQLGRGALISAILIGAFSAALYAWSQAPWTGAIDVKESEWQIRLSADRHTAGEVTFDLSNHGTISHQFLVVASVKSAAELLALVDPTTNRIDEELLDVVDERPEYDAATTAELTLTLPEGHYVVMCNIEGHYKAGMYADFDVVQ